jgi:LmbE family N-acetylglucosaminyl deacetylase
LRILAIGAHFDDVEIACGGTIARAVANGNEVRLLVLTDSAYKNYDGQVRRTRDEAIEEGWASARILGIKDIHILNFPTLDLPYNSDVVGQIEAYINDFKPEVIFTHWPHDTHQDHRAAALATLSAARWYSSLLMYEPMMPAGRSYVGFRPQFYVDVSDFMRQKIEALKAHTSQHRKFGDAWIEAIEARCRLRGFELGVRYAEAFEAVRFEWRL